jgi:hypothetical protein
MRALEIFIFSRMTGVGWTLAGKQNLHDSDRNSVGRQLRRSNGCRKAKATTIQMFSLI